MKRVYESCEVKTRADRPVPYLFKWEDQTWEIREIIEVWRLETRWWTDEGPERRTYYRCLTHSGKASRGGNTVVELFKRRRSRKTEWVLARLAD